MQHILDSIVFIVRHVAFFYFVINVNTLKNNILDF